MKKALLFIATFILIPLSAIFAAESGDDAFRKAQKDGSYYHAASLYAKELNGAVLPQAEQYFNMANSLFLAGDDASAAALYAVATTINPGHISSRRNGEILLAQYDSYSSGAKPLLLLFCRLLGLGGGIAAYWLVAVFLSLLCALALVFGYYQKQKVFIKIWPLYILLLFALIGLGYWESRIKNLRTVRVDQTVMRKGDGPIYEETAALPLGSKVTFIEERSGWIKVRIVKDRRTGWVQARDVISAEDVIESYVRL